jgi:hypothetical protein
MSFFFNALYVKMQINLFIKKTSTSFLYDLKKKTPKVLFDFEKNSKNLEPKAVLKSNNNWVLSGMIHVCTNARKMQC